jgi:hypothetical protein
MSDKPAPSYPASWRPSLLNEILHRAYEPPPWILEDLLPHGAGLLCSGLPHSTKSLSWLAAAIESVAKHTVWGKFSAAGVKRVLYIETEDPRWLVEDRARGIAQGFGLKPGELENLGFGLAVTGPFDITTHQVALLELVKDFKPDWAVLSTLQGLLRGRDWKEQKDMSDVNAILVQLQRIVPLVVLTHSPRDGQRRAAGTITQDANYLTLMHLEKSVRNGQTIINVEGDSKMGSELNFDLRIEVAEVNDAGKMRTQVRSVNYEYQASKRELVIDALLQHQTADTSAIALMCGCSESYVRTLKKEAKLKRDLM